MDWWDQGTDRTKGSISRYHSEKVNWDKVDFSRTPQTTSNLENDTRITKDNLFTKGLAEIYLVILDEIDFPGRLIAK